MPDYRRATTATTLEALPEPLRAAFVTAADEGLLTVPPTALAFVTHSERLRRVGILSRMLGGDRDSEHLTAVVIGPKDILVGTHGEHRGTAVMTARLEDLDTAPLVARTSPLAAALDADDGITLNGFAVGVAGGSGRGSYYVGLGPPDGDSARAAVEGAIQEARA